MLRGVDESPEGVDLRPPVPASTVPGGESLTAQPRQSERPIGAPGLGRQHSRSEARSTPHSIMPSGRVMVY